MTDNEFIELLGYKVKVGCELCDIKDKECCTTCLYNLAKLSLDLNKLQKEKLDDLERDVIPKLQESLSRANKYGVETDKENESLKAEVKRLEENNRTLSNVIKNSFLLKAGFEVDALTELKLEAKKELVERAIAELEKIPQYHFSLLTVTETINKILKNVGGE